MYVQRGENLPQILRPLLYSSSLSTPYPIEKMQTRSGLLSAFWRSSIDPWYYTAGIALFSVIIARTSITTGQQFQAFINFLATDPAKREMTVFDGLVSNAGWWLAFLVLTGALKSSRHWVSSNLVRETRKWIDGQVNQVMYSGDNPLLLHLNNGSPNLVDKDGKPLEDIEQRKTESLKCALTEFVGLSMGAMTSLSALYFAAVDMYEKTQPVAGVGFLGRYGTLCTSFAMTAAGVGISMYFSGKIGKVLTKLGNDLESAEAKYRSHTLNTIRRSPMIAGSNGYKVINRINGYKYDDVDKSSGRFIAIQTGHMMYTEIQSPLSTIIGYGVSIPNFLAGTFGFKQITETAGTVIPFVNNSEWIINSRAAISNGFMHLDRYLDLPKGLAKAQRTDEFYDHKCAFDYVTQDETLGLVIDNLRIKDPRNSDKVLLTVNHISLKPGDCALLSAPSGCGKSSFFKSIAGKYQWTNGDGSIQRGSDNEVLYVNQDNELDQTSLKQLVTWPSFDEEYDDQKIEFLLQAVGLGQYQKHLHEYGLGSKSWNGIFSGGEKLRVVIARAILQKKRLLLLDEPFAALDDDAAVDLMQLIKSQSSESIIMVIKHGKEMMVDHNGQPFFNVLLEADTKTKTVQQSSIAVKIKSKAKTPSTELVKPLAESVNISGSSYSGSRALHYPSV